MWSYRTAFIFKTFHELFNDCQFLKLTTRKFVRYCKYLPVLPSTCLLWNLMWYFAGELCLQMFEIKGLFLSAMYFSRYNLVCVSACLNISMTMILTCKPKSSIHCMFILFFEFSIPTVNWTFYLSLFRLPTQLYMQDMTWRKKQSKAKNFIFFLSVDHDWNVR